MRTVRLNARSGKATQEFPATVDIAAAVPPIGTGRAVDVDGSMPLRLESQGTTAVVDQPASSAIVVRFPDAPADNTAPLLERGVYLTPWFFRGRRTLVVIDHTHSVIHYEPVTDNGDRDAQVQALRVMLSALDPVRLRVV